MIREKSCGAVVYCRQGKERLYLIEKMIGGHYAMCKGHVEDRETEEETALREIFEETGLRVTVDTAFREIVSYSPSEGHFKDVIYFVASSGTMETVNQEEEVQAIQWLPLQQARQRLSYESDRQVLDLADAYLEANGR